MILAYSSVHQHRAGPARMVLTSLPAQSTALSGSCASLNLRGVANLHRTSCNGSECSTSGRASQTQQRCPRRWVLPPQAALRCLIAAACLPLNKAVHHRASQRVYATARVAAPPPAVSTSGPDTVSTGVEYSFACPICLTTEFTVHKSESKCALVLATGACLAVPHPCCLHVP